MNQFIQIVEGIICSLPTCKLFSDLRYRWFKNKLKFSGGTFFSCTGLTILTPEKISIGKDVFFNKNVYLAALAGRPSSSITIGNNCNFGMNVCIIAGNHDYRKGMKYVDSIGGHITIGNNVWVGANVVILPGVVIDDHAVVGAGSVVTHDVKARTVVAGIPAKEIKTFYPTNW